MTEVERLADFGVSARFGHCESKPLSSWNPAARSRLYALDAEPFGIDGGRRTPRP